MTQQLQQPLPSPLQSRKCWNRPEPPAAGQSLRLSPAPPQQRRRAPPLSQPPPPYARLPCSSRGSGGKATTRVTWRRGGRGTPLAGPERPMRVGLLDSNRGRRGSGQLVCGDACEESCACCLCCRPTWPRSKSTILTSTLMSSTSTGTSLGGRFEGVRKGLLLALSGGWGGLGDTLRE